MSSKAITEKPESEAPPERTPWQPARETAPSLMQADEPMVARWAGMFGLCFLLLGAAAFLLTVTKIRPNALGTFWGGIAFFIGACLLLYHAVSDADLQVRRGYAFLGYLWLAAGAILAILAMVPGNTNYFLPYGYTSLILGLMFLMAFVRHETEKVWHDNTLYLILASGVVLAATGLIGSNWRVDFMLNKGGLLLSLLGVAFLWGFVALRGSADDLAYKVGIGIGLVGIFVVLVAIGQSFIPDLFFKWRWIAKRPPADYLESAGLLMMAVGLIYTAVAAGLVSESRFVVLTRRELAAFFYSPLAYIMLFCFALLAAVEFALFMSRMLRGGLPSPLPEPIIQSYVFDYIPVFVMVLVVPLVTMRLFSEERRTATLEVLFTAPVQELPVVLSKFLAALFFFVMLWLPFGLFLIALRLEGGQSFDYRPLISFTIGLVASGAGFISMGLFISSLTRNQVAAGVLTAVVMLSLFVLGLLNQFQGMPKIPFISTLIMKTSYMELWQTTLEGRLYPKDILVHISAAIFWLYLTVKVLEARKWR